MSMATITHLFTPQATNNFRARILHNSGLFLIAISLVVVQIGIHIAPPVGLKVLGYASQIPATEVINLTNQKRTAEGQLPLTENSLLTQAAVAKGQHMLENNYWAHVAPDGTEPWAFFGNVGYSYQYAGENLARDFTNPSSTVDAWMASPTHRDNLLSPRYQEIGIGVVEGDLNGVDTTIVVQLFGSPSGNNVVSIPEAAAASNEIAQAQEPEPSATPEPTPTPTEKPTPAAIGEVELPPPTISSSSTLLSPLTLSRAVSFGLIGLLALVLIVDALIVARKGINRRTARRVAHLSFLGLVLAIVVLARSGQII